MIVGGFGVGFACVCLQRAQTRSRMVAGHGTIGCVGSCACRVDRRRLEIATQRTSSAPASGAGRLRRVARSGIPRRCGAGRDGWPVARHGFVGADGLRVGAIAGEGRSGGRSRVRDASVGRGLLVVQSRPRPSRRGRSNGGRFLRAQDRESSGARSRPNRAAGAISAGQGQLRRPPTRSRGWSDSRTR